MKRSFFGALVVGAGLSATAWSAPADHNGHIAPAKSAAPTTQSLPLLPPNLPAWLGSNDNLHVFPKRGPYNFAVSRLPVLNRDLNGVAVGHALAYEALVTGREDQLETKVYDQIVRVLKNPPRLMPSEARLSPTFGRKYGVLELVFDWTHVSHAQTIDNFIHPGADFKAKDAETRVLWDYYKEQGKPFLVTSLPMNMAWLDSQPYSQAFRRKYPKVNALFWGYHWLQTSIYDGLRGKTLEEQKRMYEILGQRYREVELYNIKRPFMPMMGETSPLFSAEFPEIANAFDNLHMLHDMVNDILASDWMSEAQKKEQIKRAVYIMSPSAHEECKPGENRGLINGILHDHRFMEGMLGMGLMKTGVESHKGTHDMSGMNHGAMQHDMNAPAAAEPKAPKFNPTELMWMPDMGWMNMGLCHHCSMPLAGVVKGRGQAWQSSTVSAEGWTMRVRCALCARDMSAETKGAAILSLSTEDPNTRVVVFSDEQGNLSTLYKGAVFLEDKAGHPRCYQWSQAFSSRAAFDAYVKENPKYADAKALSFEEWANIAPDETPETYIKEEGPVKNPYAEDLKARGINPQEAE